MAGHTKPNLLTNPKPPATTATATATFSFGGFFGCSDVNSVAIIKVAATDPQYTRKIKTKKKKKKPNWFSNWSTKIPLPAAAAAASSDSSASPAEETEAGGLPTSKNDDGNTNPSPEFSTKSKFMIKWTKKTRQSSSSAVTCTVDTADEAVSSAAEVPPSDGGESIPKETSRIGSSEEDNIVVGSVPNHTEEKAPNRATSKKRFSFCRNRAEINDRATKNRSSISQPGTPVPKPNRNGAVPISRSTTFPGPEHLVRQQVQLLQPPALAGRSRGKDERRLDSVVGLSIITVTLVIMMVWGRFCAIVCTSAWLYFIPRLRTTLSEVKVKPNPGRNASTGSYELGGGSGQTTDLDSVEYKRRVVLEGLLERKRHILN